MVVPIRPNADEVFERNAPIINEPTQERLDHMRYEEGLCRICDASRGEFTPWCVEHYPWSREEWVKRP